MMWRKYIAMFPLSRFLLRKAEQGRSQDTLKRLLPFIDKSQSVIDIGAGTCVLSSLIQKQNINITALDLINYSVVDDILPIVYNGGVMPFNDKVFDIAIIPFVLHHTPDPDAILNEAFRIAHCVIVVEDLIGSKIQTSYTYFIDSLLNIEFFGHPHTNRTFSQWMDTFRNRTIVHAYQFNSPHWYAPLIKHGLFVVNSSPRKTA